MEQLSNLKGLSSKGKDALIERSLLNNTDLVFSPTAGAVSNANSTSDRSQQDLKQRSLLLLTTAIAPA